MSDKLSDAAAKAVNGLTDGVSSLVQAFKQLAPHAWEVLVRQQIVEGVINLLVYAVGFIALWVFIRLSRKIAYSVDSDGKPRGYFGDTHPSAALPFVLAPSVWAACCCGSPSSGCPRTWPRSSTPSFMRHSS